MRDSVNGLSTFGSDLYKSMPAAFLMSSASYVITFREDLGVTMDGNHLHTSSKIGCVASDYSLPGRDAPEAGPCNPARGEGSEEEPQRVPSPLRNRAHNPAQCSRDHGLCSSGVCSCVSLRVTGSPHFIGTVQIGGVHILPRCLFAPRFLTRAAWSPSLSLSPSGCPRLSVPL